MEMIQGELITVSSMKEDLHKLGVREGMTLIVHSSFKSLGSWVAGGPPAVILALEQALGPDGTLVMPTHSGHLSDPGGWRNPPAPEEWWDTIRQEMPAYSPDLTPLWEMGIIPEYFRKQDGTIRSGHPLYSFAARGKHAAFITGGHALDQGFGEQSPLARIYDLDGRVLLLGVGNENNTSIHLAEWRADYPGKRAKTSTAPMSIDGKRQWVKFGDLEWDSDDFETIGEQFGRETGLISRGRVASAEAMLIPQRAIIDYAMNWMKENRVAALNDTEPHPEGGGRL